MSNNGMARNPVNPPMRKLTPYKNPKFSLGKRSVIKVACTPYVNARNNTSKISVTITCPDIAKIYDIYHQGPANGLSEDVTCCGKDDTNDGSCYEGHSTGCFIWLPFACLSYS